MVFSRRHSYIYAKTRIQRYPLVADYSKRVQTWAVLKRVQQDCLSQYRRLRIMKGLVLCQEDNIKREMSNHLKLSLVVTWHYSGQFAWAIIPLIRFWGCTVMYNWWGLILRYASPFFTTIMNNPGGHVQPLCQKGVLIQRAWSLG